ncbi:hypothetical protein TSUD_39020 [Trifolium subterraneum]|uniref:MULE transposase domain-containing protein n=1 Tax=Trifolium subterraneum TaxID=3900 RepID=A0A2Z6MFT4_TRISU|nr:hypothetical protein TSUD_39020 [Trifolium subterraneum]
MQQLLKCLEDHKYIYKIRTVGESTTVQDIFWAHPDSVKLFNTFPTVLLMDSTYKTNRYKMPLFEIVGVTSTEMSYNIGFAFIANEKEENFTWVLEMCLTLLKCKDTVPKVVVTDRDTALMNAVAKIFPNSTALVCQYHIYKNVRAKCKSLCSSKDVKSKQLWNTVMGAWEEVMYSPSEESYVDAVVQFRKVCEKFPKFINYVESTILDPLKEKLVRAWTNRVMHIGNTTTNRVESQHGVLKKYLLDSKGDLVKGWEAINKMLTVQLTEIQTSFGKNNTVVEHHFQGHFLYPMLVYNISRHALRLDEVNTHWKRLRIDDYAVEKDGNVDVTCLTEFNAIQERLKSVDYSMKLQIREQLHHIAFPETTSLTPPVEIAKTKGAKKRVKSSQCDSSTTRSPSYWEHVDSKFPDSPPSQSKPLIPKRKTARMGIFSPEPTPILRNPLIHHMPLFMHSYIEDIIDVKGDGHCGFRVVAEHLERLQYINDGLYPPKIMPISGIAPVDKWLTFPDMGHILATAYNKVVVELTKPEIGISETFFPLRGWLSIATNM